LGVTPMEHSLAAKSVQMRASSGKCNKPASAVFLRGHYLKEEKPNPGSLPAIMAKIALKGKCHVTPQSLLLIHHSILGSDEGPLRNAMRVTDFLRKHKIENVFCGHTHELELMKSMDLYHGHAFTLFMCGSLSSSNHINDDNMFLYYENWGTDNPLIHLVRIFTKGGKVQFKTEYIKLL